MPLSPAQLRAALPEFVNLRDVQLQAALDEAYLRTGESWGDLRDAGAKWMAADLVASSVMAEPSAKGVTSAGLTVYRRNWNDLLAQVRVFGTSISAPCAAPEAGD